MHTVVTKAREFIELQGTALQKCAAATVFEECNTNELITEMGKYQNDDGGWGNGLEAEYQGQLSSATSTAAALSHMHYFGLGDTAIYNQTIAWLENRQATNGSWDEPKEIGQFEIPPYMQPGVSTEYITGMIFKWLNLHQATSPTMLNLAQQYLVDRFPDVSKGNDFWAAIGYANAFGTMPTHALSPQVFSWVQAVLNPTQDNSADASGSLSWMQIQGMIYDNDPMLHQLGSQVIQAIKENQQEDGSWPHQFGTYNQVWAAVLVLRYLKQEGHV